MPFELVAISLLYLLCSSKPRIIEKYPTPEKISAIAEKSSAESSFAKNKRNPNLTIKPKLRSKIFNNLIT
jgi:hypothetical protein